MLHQIVNAVRRLLRIGRRVELTRGIPTLREERKIVKRLRFYWHIHHDVVVEPLLHPIEERRRFIRKYKPEPERELRLRLIKPVKGKLPKEVIRAGRVMLKAFARTETIIADYERDRLWAGGYSAHAAYQAAWSGYMRCHTVYSAILRTHSAEVEALHRAECPACPWDGRTIFPKEEA